MTSMSNTCMTLADFERLLDVYGGERTQWPGDARAAAAQLVARDPKAGRLLAEAEALDRVLERAPLPALAREAALADRIVAAAQRSPRIVRIAGAVLAETAASKGSQGAAWKPRLVGSELRAAGLLAACLAAGIMIGLSNLPHSVAPELADLAGVGFDRGSYNLAQVEPFDEDVL
jgi:hypothetical protein